MFLTFMAITHLNKSRSFVLYWVIYKAFPSDEPCRSELRYIKKQALRDVTINGEANFTEFIGPMKLKDLH